MSNEIRENLFSGSDTIRRKGTGGEATSGVGMVLVKKYVDLHLGNIEVDTIPDKGTEFTVQIPV